jgi:PKD repeat protein
MRLIDGYLHDVGADSGKLTNVFSLDGQYTGPGKTRASYKSTFRGAYTDTTPYPANGCTEPRGQATCLSDAQIRAELKAFIQTNGLPTGPDVIYFLLTPPAVTVCTDTGEKGNCSDSTTTAPEEGEGITNGLCGYHSAIEPLSASPIVYGVQPWVAGNAGEVTQAIPLLTETPKQSALACQNGTLLVEPNQTGALSPFGDYESGLADVIVDDLSVEQNNIVADPLLTGWYQSGTNAEQSDMCLRAFPPAPEPLPEIPKTTHALPISDENINGNHYYLQWGFSSVGVTSGKGTVCWSGTELQPHYTAPNPVNVGDLVGFDANESSIALDANLTKTNPVTEPFTAPVYQWNFGDGTTILSGTGFASVFHPYAHSGEYTVTLTVSDSGENVASYSNSITVVGPPAGSPGPTAPGPTETTSGGAPGAATGAGVGGGVGGATAPAVTESPLSRSLKKVVRLGLAIHYTVDEQVAGQAEALLDSRTAARLGIKARTAVGLPKGFPRSLVIGSAVLVTTKGGQGTIRIKFSKAVAKRLARARRVKLTLRFVVRNASRTSPRTTTVLSTVILSH